MVSNMAFRVLQDIQNHLNEWVLTSKLFTQQKELSASSGENQTFSRCVGNKKDDSWAFLYLMHVALFD